MKRSQRLNPVVELTTKAVKEALAKVGEANANWTTDKLQLDDLMRYKAEYLARFRQDELRVTPIKKVMELRAFLVQLDQAIAVQQAQVKQSLAILHQQQAEWRTVRVKEKAVQSLVERYQQQELALALKQEQADADEYNITSWHLKPR